MIYRQFQDKQLSALGFGCMRLPEKDGQIDIPLVEAMTEYALANGVNYFDTAFPYHGGMSERVMGQVLSKYPRESYYLADKLPGHQCFTGFDPAPIFEEQLRRCQTDYFDFYLLHNVYEKSLETYLNTEYDILGYLREQKRLGRIKHLGFSTHAQLSTLEKILDLIGDDMEFCQIQLNYLDWTLQQGKEKYELLTSRGIPVWVMEPVRGGKLANFTDARLEALRPGKSTASWGFRFLQELPNVAMTLSGMSNMEQMVDNVATYAEASPLSQEENALLLQIAEGLKNAIPCTGCRYCCDGCPMGLDIPTLMSICSDVRFDPKVNTVMVLQTGPAEKRPDACIACGKCTKICPQGIDIPAVMKELTQRMASIPQWADICAQRAVTQPIGK